MRKYYLTTFITLMLFLIGACKNIRPDEFSLEKQIIYCEQKANTTLSNIDGDTLCPRNVLSGENTWNFVDRYDWTSGFWPGMLWYMYELTGEDKWNLEARKYTGYLEPLAYGDPNDHDLGFQIFCSYGNGYRLTSDSVYKKVILSTAAKLAELYNPTVGTILSWPGMREKMGWPHNTIIDNMMNLELLFWASKNGGSKELYDIAVKHAEKTMENLVRDDFSTYHVAVFDTTDGRFIKGVTHQGYADESKWMRGQAWGIYGFTMSYRETGRNDFLEMAQKLADTFISLLPNDKIPYWDSEDPAIPNAPRDASAAAIAASALLELSTLLDAETGQEYRETAVDLISKLSTEKYLSGEDNPAFLLHSTGHKPNNSEVDASIIYADYYYLEALMRLKMMEAGS
jgi:unsaturated chondroitin disaccharide hydrolase